MNMKDDEIKEILDKIKEIYDIHEQIIIKYNNADEITFFLSIKEGKLLLDYIIDLQQENISLAKENEQEKQFIKDCGFENIQQLALDYIGIRQEKEDYKSRCEKAVEYIKQLEHSEWITFGRKILLDILNDRRDK